MVWTLENITDKNSFQNHLQLAAVFYQASSAAIVIMDAAYKILEINPAFTVTTGFSSADLENKEIVKIFDLFVNPVPQEEIISSIKAKGSWKGELLIRRKTNDYLPALVLIDGMQQVDGRISHHAALLLDISDRKQLEHELRHHAEFDPLTNLVNRNLFFQRLTDTLASAKRFQYTVALLYLDLDGFKQVNDRLGHSEGDNVLIEVASRLSGGVREVDTAARLGGDEFVIILNGTSKETIAVTAQRIIDLVTFTVTQKGIELGVSASIGIAIYPDDTMNAMTLLKYADAAMYSAKLKGKSQFCWHIN